MLKKQDLRSTPHPSAGFRADQTEQLTRQAIVTVETYAMLNSISVARACREAEIPITYWDQYIRGSRPMQARHMIAAFGLLDRALVPTVAQGWGKDFELTIPDAPIHLPPAPDISKPKSRAKPKKAPRNYA